VKSVDELSEEHERLVGHMVLTAQKLARNLGLGRGYRLVMNCGEEGGQSVWHLHLHLLGGRSMHWPPG
jgi:histidine triad (HIT) family protein